MLKIDGYVNPKAPSVIYFNDSQRIIVAAFSKNTKLNFFQRITGKDGKWDKVSLEIWTDKKEFTANAWPAIFRSMTDRTGIDKKTDG